MATWQKKWREIYIDNPTCFTPFYFWLQEVKRFSQLEMEQLELDSDESEVLLKEYGEDPEINRLTEKCLQEMGMD
jgi:hypothetical protein